MFLSIMLYVSDELDSSDLIFNLTNLIKLQLYNIVKKILGKIKMNDDKEYIFNTINKDKIGALLNLKDKCYFCEMELFNQYFCINNKKVQKNI